MSGAFGGLNRRWFLRGLMATCIAAVAPKSATKGRVEIIRMGPTVGGSINTWGSHLNTDLQQVWGHADKIRFISGQPEVITGRDRT